MVTKSLIQVFPQPKWINTISCDGKPCGTGGGCGSNTTTDSKGNCHSEACGDSNSCDSESMLKWFSEKYKDKVEMNIADYSSINSIINALDELNNILEYNSEELRVTLENIELVFSQIAPFVAVNKVLAFVGKMPTEQELLETLDISIN
jgi:hypothetical protein